MCSTYVIKKTVQQIGDRDVNATTPTTTTRRKKRSFRQKKRKKQLNLVWNMIFVRHQKHTYARTLTRLPRDANFKNSKNEHSTTAYQKYKICESFLLLSSFRYQFIYVKVSVDTSKYRGRHLQCDIADLVVAIFFVRLHLWIDWLDNPYEWVSVENERKKK